MPQTHPHDAAHMRAALALAARGLGECWPNPSVGCVIAHGARVVARARTAPGGRPHAETQALALAGPAARGATAYVTLEPCAHTGQTPPCADALIEAGIARVVVALADPDPRVNGAGIARLRAAGIPVTEHLQAGPALHLAAGFIHRIRDHRPLITLKLATTLDGRIATATRESQWITVPLARRAAHALRAGHDAILVGAGTLLADNPSLTCRLPGARTRPLIRLIADSHLRTPLTSAVLDTRAAPTWFLIRPDADPARIAAIHAAGAETVAIPPAPAGIDLTVALHTLAARGLTSILVEGGAQLAASLLRDNRVDRLAWFHAPVLIGGDGIPALQPFGVTTLAAAPRFHPTEHRRLGPDTLTLLDRDPPLSEQA